MNTTIKITPEMEKAFADELGREIDGDTAEQIESIIEGHQRIPIGELKKSLKQKEKEFEKAGGRGIDIADEIDSLRGYLAIHKFLP